MLCKQLGKHLQLMRNFPTVRNFTTKLYLRASCNGGSSFLRKLDSF